MRNEDFAFEQMLVAQLNTQKTEPTAKPAEEAAAADPVKYPKLNVPMFTKEDARRRKKEIDRGIQLRGEELGSALDPATSSADFSIACALVKGKPTPKECHYLPRAAAAALVLNNTPMFAKISDEKYVGELRKRALLPRAHSFELAQYVQALRTLV